MDLDAERPEPRGVDASAAETAPAVDAGPTPKAPTPAEADQAERLVREGVILRRRGESAAATQKFEAAFAIAPGSPEVTVVLAEELMARRQWAKARTRLEWGLAVNPNHKQLGQLHADCVFAILSSDMEFTRPLSEVESVASGKTALVLSILVPGLGQIVNGRTKVGGIMLGGYLICWIMLLLLPGGASGILSLMMGGRGASSFNGLALLPLFGSVGMLLWSVVDAQRQSPMNKRPTIERPRPPVDKDFEL